MHPDVHARLIAHRWGHELVAGGAHDFPGQHHRAHPDGPQRPRGYKIRYPVSRVLPRIVRHVGREYPGPGRVWLVRYPGMDRWRRDLQNSRGIHPVDREWGDIARAGHLDGAVPLL